MKKLLLVLFLSLFVMSCSSGESGGNEENTPAADISEKLKSEYNKLLIKSEECSLNHNEKYEQIIIDIETYYKTTNALTESERTKYSNCIANIKTLTCDSEAVINFELSTVPDCLYYENTEGFPTGKDICETHLKGFCQAPRHCVDGVYCDMYEGAKPFRQDCAESGNDTGAYTCTGDYDNAPFCKPFWVEYTSGCHDEPGYVKENSFDDLCDKFGNVLLIEDDSIVEQFETCYNARPQTCEGLYDINYDISTVPECQFIFEE